MAEILLRQGRIVDPSLRFDRVADLLIRDDKIVGIDAEASPAAIVIDCVDRIVSPGLIDTNVQLREPGWEEDETIQSGTAAALAGGFTSIACVPASDPPIDSQAGVEFVLHQAERAGHCNVFVLACVSKGRQGKELAELGTLHEAGAIGFTDADRSIDSAELMRRALEYAAMFDCPILNHPEVDELNHGGIMHEGLVSTLLGLPGLPAEAEDVMTGRDLRLAASTGARLHLLNISSGGSVELIRRAKQLGSAATAGIAAHHFSLTDDFLRTFDSNGKVNPPLRSRQHVQDCIVGLSDDTLDVICSGHAPRSAEKKIHELDRAPFGINGLETTLSLVVTHLIEPGHLTWLKAIEKLSQNPAKILKLQGKGTLAAGADADVTVIDPRHRAIVNADEFFSLSRNTPFVGQELAGRADLVIVGGEVKFDRLHLYIPPAETAGA